MGVDARFARCRRAASRHERSVAWFDSRPIAAGVRVARLSERHWTTLVAEHDFERWQFGRARWGGGRFRAGLSEGGVRAEAGADERRPSSVGYRRLHAAN